MNDKKQKLQNEKLSKYERLDLRISAFVGIASLLISICISIVTLIIASQQNKIASQQNNIQIDISKMQKRIAQEQNRIIKESGKDSLEGNIVQSLVPYLKDIASNDDKSCIAWTILTKLGIYMSNEHGRENLRNLQGQLKFDPSICYKHASQRKPPAKSLQFAEATTPNIKNEGFDYWFTVLGSYSISKKGLKAAQRQVNKLKQNSQLINKTLSLQIFQTIISRNYAVTLGGLQSSSEAKSLAIEARRLGWAKDAFAQPNRNWILYSTEYNRFQLFLHLGSSIKSPVLSEDTVRQTLELKGFHVVGVDYKIDEYGPGVDYFFKNDKKGAEQVAKVINELLPEGTKFMNARKQRGNSKTKEGTLGIWF